MRPPVWGALSDRQMRHEAVGRGAVPVFFARGCEDDIAGVEFDDPLPGHLDQARMLLELDPDGVVAALVNVLD